MREIPEDFKGKSVDLNAHAEMRDAPRTMPLIRAAKLVLDSGEYLCVLRDVSSTGISIRLFHTLPASKNICLEMPDGDCFDVLPVWSDGDRAGFRFAEPIDVKALVTSRSTHPKRSLRAKLSHPAFITHAGRTIRVQLANISQQGACIISEEFLALDERVDLHFEYFEETKCTVRWRKEPHYGICFGRTLAFAAFAAIVEAVNHDKSPNHLKPDLSIFPL